LHRTEKSFSEVRRTTHDPAWQREHASEMIKPSRDIDLDHQEQDFP
jgi:hypothetical protein